MGDVAVHVRPASSRDALKWDSWRCQWVVSCRARPVRGLANAAVIRLLSEWLAIPAEGIELRTGLRSQEKTIRIPALDDREIHDRLERAAVRPVRASGG